MRPIVHAVPGAVAELLRGAPMSPGKMLFAWKTAVGSAFDRVTSIHLEGSVLMIDADTAHWAREIGRSTPIILRRLQTLLGETAVTSITIRARTGPRG